MTRNESPSSPRTRDRIDVAPSGALRVVDYKTGKAPPETRGLAEAKAKRAASESDRPSPEQPSLFPPDAATPEPAPSHPAPESD